MIPRELSTLAARAPRSTRATVLNVRPEEVARAALLGRGTVVHPRSLHTEWIYAAPHHPDRWVALATGCAGAKATFAEQPSLELPVSTVDILLVALAKCGLEPRTRIEWFRTAYVLGRARCDVDEMPGGYCWLGVDSPDPEGVRATLRTLGCPERAEPLSRVRAYREHGVDVLAHSEISFTRPPRAR